jgi:hypothetical protein
MRKKKPPTPKEVKALADQVDQSQLFHLFMADPNSGVRKLFMALVDHEYNERVSLERRLGISTDTIDPDGLLTKIGQKKETDKQIKKRLGYSSTQVVKNMRSRVRKKIAKAAVPPRSLPLR